LQYPGAVADTIGPGGHGQAVPTVRPGAVRNRPDSAGHVHRIEAPMQAIAPVVIRVMSDLEARDAADRTDGTPVSERLRAIGPQTGEFLRTLVVATNSRTIVEVGTSSGYSALWLALGAMLTGGMVTTFEIDPAKVALARDTFARAGMTGYVDLRQADGGAGLVEFRGRADLVFIDSEKVDYLRFLDAAAEALRPGGLFVADNLISHAASLEDFRAAALADPRLSGLVVPVGQGELVAVRL
jgi:caffeoyl-CoA O-methyltransferase